MNKKYINPESQIRDIIGITALCGVTQNGKDVVSGNDPTDTPAPPAPARMLYM